MSAVNLLTPILTGGIQNINFVNGRVLAAEDMTGERSATLQRQRLIGKCVGDGIASGFEVTLSSSSVAYGQQVVHITAGVAMNRNGDVLQLSADTDVTLTATFPSVTVNGLFAPCAPPQTQLTNPGVYVLTVLPASGYQGQAPVTLLNSAGVATSCSSRYQTSGVQFRLSLVTLARYGHRSAANAVHAGQPDPDAAQHRRGSRDGRAAALPVAEWTGPCLLRHGHPCDLCRKPLCRIARLFNVRRLRPHRRTALGRSGHRL